MELKKNQLFQFGFLNTKDSLFLFLTLFLSLTSFLNKGDGNKLIVHRDIYGDTVNTKLNNKLIITIIEEPTCTGCKVELLKLNYQNRKKTQHLYLLDWRFDVVDRKNYRNHILDLNPEARLIYSISDDSITFRINTIQFNLKNKLTPYQIWIDNEEFNVVPYDSIFKGIQFRESYKQSLKTFINK